MWRCIFHVLICQRRLLIRRLLSASTPPSAYHFRSRLRSRHRVETPTPTQRQLVRPRRRRCRGEERPSTVCFTSWNAHNWSTWKNTKEGTRPFTSITTGTIVTWQRTHDMTEDTSIMAGAWHSSFWHKSRISAFDVIGPMAYLTWQRTCHHSHQCNHDRYEHDMTEDMPPFASMQLRQVLLWLDRRHENSHQLWQVRDIVLDYINAETLPLM